ncbi:RluA family pseudouridine synthase [Anaerosporobacter faecicola]|uniref:RluA family pseudouridine synthase n=1 Tax=Anaerosporobacter faecicola TaxID=2718714 RepID=UPI0014393441|nr:RluA family pseudouridine synthase [Anaerosporobacter faecicola]
MSSMRSNIIYEDNHLLVCEKPVGMLVQSDRSMSIDMVNELKNYLYEKQLKEKPGDSKEPYIGLINRLDRPVGGILVFAKTGQVARALSEQVQAEQPQKDTEKKQTQGKNRISKMQKKYYAVVDGDLSTQLGCEPVKLQNYLIKDAKTNTSRITTENDKNGKRAILTYQVRKVGVDEMGYPVSLVEVELKTGRHHQIRVQMAANHMPLWGDTKYNTSFIKRQKEYPSLKWANVGLYSYSLTFQHPITKKELHFTKTPKEGIFQVFSV